MRLRHCFALGTVCLSPILASALTLEGGMSGGGGKGVVCRDKQNQIVSVETLDLFESRALYQTPSRHFNEPWEKVVDIVKSELSDAMFEPEINLFPLIQRSQKIVKWVGPEVQLIPVDDAALVAVPSHCSVEQLAVYVDDSLLLVRKNLWEKMDSANQASLFLHEAIYRMDRYDGAKNSRRARRLVGMALAGFPFEDMNSGQSEDSKSCSSLDGKYIFRVSERATNDSPHPLSELRFSRYAGRWIFGKTSAILPMSWNRPCSVEKGPSNNIACSGGTLDSQTEGAEQVAFVGEQETSDQKIETRFYLLSPQGERHELDSNCFF